MKIIFHKKFMKDFSKLSQKQQERIDETVALFRQNPFHPLLNNHALKGEFQGFRSISVGGDFRLFFIEEENYKRVVFMAAGTHSQLY